MNKTVFEKHPTPWYKYTDGTYRSANGQIVMIGQEHIESIVTLVNACAGLKHPEKLGQLRAGLDELCVRMEDMDTNNISQMNYAIAMASVVCMYYRAVVGDKDASHE
jgi:hypothetical protein